MAKLSPEERSTVARKAAQAKSELQKLPKATHIGELKIGDAVLPCAVLPDGTRLISQGGIASAFGPVTGGWQMRKKEAEEHAGDLPPFLVATSLQPFISEGLRTLVSAPKRYKDPRGGPARIGLDATLIPMVCEVWLKARDAGKLTKIQEPVAYRAEILMRGLAHLGIVALVDEATGYQKDRAKDALAKILEAYVAKELQPWVKTFDSDFYEQMFRLRGISYPPENPNFRPQYFGKLTNDIVYCRLAPGVLEALKQENAKSEKKSKLHQHLTAGYGRQNLLKHLGKTQALMEVSEGWQDFMMKLNKVAPRYGETIPLDLDETDR